MRSDKLVGYKKLIAWQLADKLARSIYELTNSFPKYELYGLTSQLRRAALSVPLNIIEGYARNSNKEFKRFLNIALGSLAETGYLLDFSFNRKYISKSKYEKTLQMKEECGRVLWKLMKSL